MSSTHVRALAAIFACVAVYGLTLGLLRPLISLILESRDYSRSIIGLVASAPAIGVLLSSFIIPPLIHRYGIRAFMIGTLILDLCVVLFYPLFDNLWAWIAISMLSGTTINCLLVASETWVNEITPDASRGRVMGLYGTTMAAA
ncbi:MAG: MFS transporter, partial [Pseudomonadales bacterium]